MLIQTRTIQKPRLHSAQRAIVRDARRFNVVVCGRRFGKTVLACDRLAAPDVAEYPVAYFAPTYKMMEEVWRTLSQVLVPITRRQIVQQHRLELITGGVVDMWSLDDPNAARGRKYKRVAIDEAALVKGLMQAWQAVIRPTLADYQGDAWLYSTPRGLDDFYTMYQWGQDGQKRDWQSWRMPTSANPYILLSEIEAMRDTMPATVFAAEVLAEFVDTGLTLFRLVDIDRAEMGAIGNQPPRGGGLYLTTVDVGRRQDATVINTYALDMRPVQRVAHERLERVPYPVIQRRIDDRAALYPGRVVVESNGVGDPVIENVDVAAEPFITTAKTKAQALQALQLLLERGEVKATWTAQERREFTQYQWDDRLLQTDEVMSWAIFAAVYGGGNTGWRSDDLQALGRAGGWR